MITKSKKIFFLLFVMSFVCANAYAAQIDSAEGAIDLFEDGVTVDTGDGNAYPALGLSPKVEAIYVTDGTDSTDTQWYAIGTIHPGGNKVYATAQDVNNVYSQDHITGTDIATSLAKVPTNSTSPDLWSTSGWEL